MILIVRQSGKTETKMLFRVMALEINGETGIGHRRRFKASEWDILCTIQQGTSHHYIPANAGWNVLEQGEHGINCGLG